MSDLLDPAACQRKPLVAAAGCAERPLDLARVRRWPQLVAVTDGEQRTLLPRCRVAASSLARLRGLLLATPQEAVDGLLLLPCDSIHTIGMAFPIDALFLDSGGEILECREAILPSRLVLSPYRTRAVLELDLDGIHRHALRPGQRLRFERLATAGDIPLDKP